MQLSVDHYIMQLDALTLEAESNGWNETAHFLGVAKLALLADRERMYFLDVESVEVVKQN